MLRSLFPPARASLIRAADMFGYSDQRRAAAPLTKGQAALVPEKRVGQPLELRLTTFWPGAASPRWPMDALKLDSCVGRPLWSIDTTGITQGFIVMHDPPTLA